MITDLKEIENSAMNLNNKDKARLADKLLQSIHGKNDPEIEQSWIDEIQKRKEALKSGEASLHSASVVLNETGKRLQKCLLSSFRKIFEQVLLIFSNLENSFPWFLRLTEIILHHLSGYSHSNLSSNREVLKNSKQIKTGCRGKSICRKS